MGMTFFCGQRKCICKTQASVVNSLFGERNRGFTIILRWFWGARICRAGRAQPRHPRAASADAFLLFRDRWLAADVKGLQATLWQTTRCNCLAFVLACSRCITQGYEACPARSYTKRVPGPMRRETISQHLYSMYPWHHKQARAHEPTQHKTKQTSSRLARREKALPQARRPWRGHRLSEARSSAQAHGVIPPSWCGANSPIPATRTRSITAMIRRANA